MYRRHSILCIESMPPLHLAEGHSLRCVEKTMSTMYRTETLSLLHRVFSPQRIDCPSVICRRGRLLICSKERVSSLDRGESVSLLYVEGRVSLVYNGSRDSSHRKATCLICREKEYVILSIGKRDTLSFATRRVSLLRV